MPALLHYALALFFLWLLAAAAAHKFLQHGYYAGLLRAALSAGETTAGILARLIAVLEAGLALAFAITPWWNMAFLATAALLAVYASGMAVLLAKGRADLKCGCSGPASDLHVSRGLVARNAVLVILALAGAAPVTGTLATVGQGVNAVLIAAFLTMVYLCTEQLLRNAQHLREPGG